MSLIKSKQRVADHGEVFTPPWMVEAMLDLVKDESERIDSRFLERRQVGLLSHDAGRLGAGRDAGQSVSGARPGFFPGRGRLYAVGRRWTANR